MLQAADAIAPQGPPAAAPFAIPATALPTFIPPETEAPAAADVA